jgi:hypothetical protein
MGASKFFTAAMICALGTDHCSSEYCIDVYHVTRDAHIDTSLVVKKNFFSFPVAVNNSIEVGPLVFLL